jgi:hypothetical protein
VFQSAAFQLPHISHRTLRFNGRETTALYAQIVDKGHADSGPLQALVGRRPLKAFSSLPSSSIHIFANGKQQKD